MGNTIAAVFLCLSAVSVKGFLSVRLLSALLLLLGLPVKLADKNTPADIGRFLNCRLPLAPLDYGKTCACLFRDITHTQHLHSADKVVGRTHRLCGQIKAALWLLSERKVH